MRKDVQNTERGRRKAKTKSDEIHQKGKCNKSNFGKKEREKKKDLGKCSSSPHPSSSGNGD